MCRGTVGQQAPYGHPPSQFSNWGSRGFVRVTHGPWIMPLRNVAAQNAQWGALGFPHASLWGALASGACLARDVSISSGQGWSEREGQEGFLGRGRVHLPSGTRPC